MRFSLFVARRYLRSRHHRGFISFITGIAIIGVALGVATLIITLSILRGFERTIKDNVVSFTAHMQLFGFSNLPLQNPEFAVQRVKERFPEVREIAPYVAREALIRSSVDIDGIILKGVDPENDISAARYRLAGGVYDLKERGGSIQPIILGKRLAEKLETVVGDTVLVFALGGLTISMAETRVMAFEVVGTFDTGMAEYDASYAYVPLASTQRLFQFGRAISGFDILVHDLARLDALSEEIPSDLGYPYYARTMYQMYRNLFAWVDLQKKPVPIILGLIIVVATVNIIGTLLMMVMEKSMDIGVLRTLGADRRTIKNVFLLQGMIIGVVGTLIGNLLGYLLVLVEMEYKLISLPSAIYYMSSVPIELSALNFYLVSAVALVLCFFSSVVPARIASGLDPVRLFKFGK